MMKFPSHKVLCKPDVGFFSNKKMTDAMIMKKEESELTLADELKPGQEMPKDIAAPDTKEKKKRVKKLKPAKGPAKAKAKEFINEALNLLNTGDKTFHYTISRPDTDGISSENMEFEIYGKTISGDEKEILNTFGIVFEKVIKLSLMAGSNVHRSCYSNDKASP